MLVHAVGMFECLGVFQENYRFCLGGPQLLAWGVLLGVK